MFYVPRDFCLSEKFNIQYFLQNYTHKKANRRTTYLCSLKKCYNDIRYNLFKLAWSDSMILSARQSHIIASFCLSLIIVYRRTDKYENFDYCCPCLGADKVDQKWSTWSVSHIIFTWGQLFREVRTDIQTASAKLVFTTGRGCGEYTQRFRKGLLL